MQQEKLIILICALATSFLVQFSDGQCNQCNQNDFACINTNSFQLCRNGVKDTTQTFTCPAGKVCTNLNVKCVEGRTPVCEESICGCKANKLFVCTSRTTFAECNGTSIINTGRCPNGLTCDTDTQLHEDICVDDCILNGKFECDRDAPEGV